MVKTERKIPRRIGGFFIGKNMEREKYLPEPNKPIEPGVLTIIVRWQIEQIIRESEQKEFIDIMNA